MTTYVIKINGVDRTNCILVETLEIRDEANDSPSTMKCNFFNNDSLGVPSLDQTIVVTKNAVDIFSGKILGFALKKLAGSQVAYGLDCVDFTRELDRNLVVENYEGKTDKEIIEDVRG
jgi:hypothetical protein